MWVAPFIFLIFIFSISYLHSTAFLLDLQTMGRLLRKGKLKATDQEWFSSGKRVAGYLCKAHQHSWQFNFRNVACWNKLINVFHRQYGVRGKFRKNPESHWARTQILSTCHQTPLMMMIILTIITISPGEIVVKWGKSLFHPQKRNKVNLTSISVHKIMIQRPVTLESLMLPHPQVPVSLKSSKNMQQRPKLNL